MSVPAPDLLYWFAFPLLAFLLAFGGILLFGGRFWGVAAAVMGPFIALDGKVTSDAPAWVQTTTLGFLLGVLAFLQLYGQSRSEQSRNAADTEISCIAAAVSGIAAGVDRQENRLSSVADAVGRQENRLSSVADAVGSIADEISLLREER
jgi:hypothetical protein